MPELLNEHIRSQVKGVFRDLQDPVQILFFGRKAGCEYCEDVRQLLQEVCDLSEKLSVSVHDLDDDAALAAEYHIDKAPGFAVLAKDGERLTDFGVHFYGIPSGHEFTTLINDLAMVSARNSGLGAETVEFLHGVKSPLLLQVFTTPT